MINFTLGYIVGMMITFLMALGAFRMSEEKKTIDK